MRRNGSSNEPSRKLACRVCGGVEVIQREADGGQYCVDSREVSASLRSEVGTNEEDMHRVVRDSRVGAGRPYAVPFPVVGLLRAV